MKSQSPIISGDKCKDFSIYVRKIYFGLLNLHRLDMPISSLFFGKHFLALAESLRILYSIFLPVPIISFKMDDRNALG